MENKTESQIKKEYQNYAKSLLKEMGFSGRGVSVKYITSGSTRGNFYISIKGLVKNQNTADIFNNSKFRSNNRYSNYKFEADDREFCFEGATLEGCNIVFK